MLSCKEVTRLASDSLDLRLPWSRRLQMSMHLAMCKYCSRYLRQIRRLRLIARRYPQQLDARADAQLSSAARERIRTAMQRSTD